jgi:acid phosphatase class B
MEGLCTQCGSPSMPSGMDSQNKQMDIYNPITAAHNEHQSPYDRMFNSDEFAQAQQNAHGGELDELDEFNQAVQDMMEEDSIPKPKPISLLPMHENKLSIARSINIMDDVIDSLGKKKILKAK